MAWIFMYTAACLAAAVMLSRLRMALESSG